MLTALGMMFWVWVGSLFFKYSFWVGFVIWFLLCCLIEAAEESEKNKAEQIASTKTCPFCAEEIKIQAKKCRHCGESI